MGNDTKEKVCKKIVYDGVIFHLCRRSIGHNYCIGAQPFVISIFLDGFLKYPSFLRGRAGVRRRPSFTFWLTFSKLNVTLILRWIAFILGRDKEENQ